MSRKLPKEVVNYLRYQDKELVEEQPRLTKTQREVLQLLAEGKIMKEVGAILNMTTRTVAFHKYKIMEVLGVKSSADRSLHPLKSSASHGALLRQLRPGWFLGVL